MHEPTQECAMCRRASHSFWRLASNLAAGPFAKTGAKLAASSPTTRQDRKFSPRPRVAACAVWLNRRSHHLQLNDEFSLKSGFDFPNGKTMMSKLQTLTLTPRASA